MKVLGEKFSYTSSPIIKKPFWAILKTSIFNKSYRGHFFGATLGNFGLFLFLASGHTGRHVKGKTE